MKPAVLLIGIPLAGVLGYVLEPTLRPAIIPSSKTTPAAKKAPAPSDDKPEFDFSQVSQDSLPEEITLLRDSALTDPDSGMSLNIKADTTVELLRVSGQTALIRPKNTNFTLSLPASHTDLVSRLTKQPAAPAPTADAPEVAAPTPEPAPITPEPAPAEPEPAPVPAPAPEPAPTPEPPAAEPPAVEPDPATASPPATPSTSPSGAQMDENQVLAVMRQSLQNKEIKEFSLQDVSSWRAEGSETIDGTTYDVGSVTYQQNSIFGVKSVTAKAYIQNGKVARWVWPKSGIVIQ